MAAEPRLRPLPPDSAEEPGSGRESRGERSGSARLSIWLGAALALTLVLLVWSRVQLGQRIAVLEDEIQELRAAVAQRDRVIDAQAGRLDDVHARVRELDALLQGPLPTVEP